MQGASQEFEELFFFFCKQEFNFHVFFYSTALENITTRVEKEKDKFHYDFLAWTGSNGKPYLLVSSSL